MANTLFRENALDSVSSPERLDSGIRLMKPSLWILASIFTVILAALIVWGFTGTIANRVGLSGVLFSISDVQQVVSMTEGVVSDVIVAEGERVGPGSIIAVVTDEKALKELEILKAEAETAEGDEKARLIEKLRNMQESYLSHNLIRSSFTGCIQKAAAVGTKLSPGDSIASVLIETAGSFNEVDCYVSIETANQLKPGMEAQITPAFLRREKYGYIYGTVTEVSAVPASEASIIRHMGTMDYIRSILPDTLYVEVRVSIAYDEDSGNLYKWSNPNGERVSIAQGTVCDIQVITSRKRPLDLLFE